MDAEAIYKTALTTAMNQFLCLEGEDPETVHALLMQNPHGYVIARYLLNDLSSAHVRHFGQRSEITIEELLRRIDELTVSITEAMQAVTQSTTLQFHGWELEADEGGSLGDDGRYIYIRHRDHPGDLRIKREDEGYVFDAWEDDGTASPVVTTYVMFDELEAEKQEAA